METVGREEHLSEMLLGAQVASLLIVETESKGKARLEELRKVSFWILSVGILLLMSLLADGRGRVEAFGRRVRRLGRR